MPPSLRDILPPEAQTILGLAALLLAALGILIWAAGIKVARGLVAVFLGLVAAALTAWILPAIIDIAAASAALIGFAIGALAGAIAFRLLQGITLALCLGLAVAGSYYRLHVDRPSVPNAAAAQPSEPVKASDLLIHGPVAGQPSPATTSSTQARVKEVRTHAQVFAAKLRDRWNAVSATDQRRMLAAGIGTAAIALLLAFAFPRPTTWVVSALLGTMLLLAGAEAAFHVYLPKLELVFPKSPQWRYLVIAALTALGMLLQYRFFWPRKKSKPQPQPQPQP